MTVGGYGTEGALLSREYPVDAARQFRCRLQCWSETCPSGFTSAVRASSLRVRIRDYLDLGCQGTAEFRKPRRGRRSDSIPATSECRPKKNRSVLDKRIGLLLTCKVQLQWTFVTQFPESA